MHDWKFLIFYKKNKLSNPIIPRRDSESPKKVMLRLGRGCQAAAGCIIQATTPG
jgi:hypothetical protein